MFGENHMYRELISRHKENLYMRDILTGTRYESYRKFVAMNNHCKSWNSWRDILCKRNMDKSGSYNVTTTYNYGESHNDETFLCDPVNTISPFHYIELKTNTGKYVVPINQIGTKNPYTNEVLDSKTYMDIKRKKEFLRMNGFPLEPIDMNHKFDMGWKPEIEILSRRLGLDISIIDVRPYILHLVNMRNKPLHAAYQIMNTHIDFGWMSVNAAKHDLENFILEELDRMDDE